MQQVRRNAIAVRSAQVPDQSRVEDTALLIVGDVTSHQRVQTMGA